MANKGLDATFVHYGVRKEDMNLIEALAHKHGLDFDWVKEDLIREYHERRIRNEEVEGKGLEKLIEKALLKIK
jgi:hypothetical protein